MRFWNPWLGTMATVGALLATATSAGAASYTYTTIDVPADMPGAAGGAIYTYANGINDVGQIVGAYEGSNGPIGFLDTNGSFTAVNALGAAGTYLNGINDAGQVVGYFVTSTGSSVNYNNTFIETNGNFTAINVPGSSFGEILGINNAGASVGVFVNGLEQSFLYTNGTYSTLPNPFPTSMIVATGINNNGQIVGSYPDRLIGGNYTHSFLYTNDNHATIDVPDASTTYANGVNDAGQIVGWFSDSVGALAQGFLYTNGVLTTVDVPGAKTTVANGINNAGQIIGYFSDDAGTHGFLATPVSDVPEPSALALFVAGLFGFGMIRRIRTAQQSIVVA